MAAPLSEKDWAALVRAHPELAAIPERLRIHATDIRAVAADTLCRIGGRPKWMLFVVEGEIRLVRRSRGGAEIVLQRTTAGFAAEASLESPRYHCDIVAAENSRLLGFPIDRFREALSDDAGFRGFWMARLAREVRKLRAQCERLSLRGAAERIEHYIEAEGSDGRLELRQTRKAWAAELGLTHEALYRALAALVRAGRVIAEEQDASLVLTIRANRK